MPKKTPSRLNEPVDAYETESDLANDLGAAPAWHLEIVKERLNDLEAEMAGAVSLDEMRKRVETRLG
jgi:hypothetical protein